MSLQRSKVDDAGLAEAARLRNLEVLVLPGTRITDAGLAHLKQLKQSLVWLDVRETNISDAGLEHLKHLGNLEVLLLDQTQISDAAVKGCFEWLKDAHGLRVLGLQGTKVTARVKSELKKVLPDCWIE